MLHLLYAGQHRLLAGPPLGVRGARCMAISHSCRVLTPLFDIRAGMLACPGLLDCCCFPVVTFMLGLGVDWTGVTLLRTAWALLLCLASLQ